MEKKPWVKQWWFWVIIGFGVIMIITPFIINWAYLSGLRNQIEPNTAFSAGDMLMLYGSVLAFIGTIFFRWL